MSDELFWHKPDSSQDEADRLEWLAGRAGAPRFISFSPDDGITMSRLSGVHAGSAEFGSAPEATVQAMVRSLCALHEIEAADCPWVLDTATRIEALRATFSVTPLNSDQVSAAYQRYSGDELLSFAEKMAADCEDDLVLTHGNIAPAHVLLEGPEVVGLVSFAHLAVADRYRDLTLLALHVAATFPAELVPVVFDTYEMANPNPVALDLAQLLLELEG